MVCHHAVSVEGSMFIIIFISCLVLMSCIDVLIREVPVFLVVMLAAMSIFRLFVRVRNDEISFVLSMFTILPGIILILVSYMYPKQIGMGDGLVLVLVLMGKDIYFELITIFVSTLGVMAASIVMMVINRREYKTIEIPFIPFITFGVICSEYML